MTSLLLSIVVALLVFTWVRASRRNRRQWLERLALPGTWSWQQGSGQLELAGGLDRGSYRLQEGGRSERGRWRLEGHTLELEAEDGQRRACDLRFFDAGRIGLHGDGLDRRIYVKALSNVVPLRRSGS